MAGAIAVLLATPLAGRRALADDAFALANDQGEALPNFKLPSELSVDKLPGILWVGAGNPDVSLVEFFDYNCPFCRRASADIDKLIRDEAELQVGFVNNAILAAGSVQAAKVHLAILKLFGPRTTYRFHMRLLAKRGAVDGPAALQLAQEMRLDRGRIEMLGNSDEIAAALRAQVKLAASIGFNVTPSFVIDGVGILGYPGPAATRRIVAAVRQCEQPVCR